MLYFSEFQKKREISSEQFETFNKKCFENVIRSIQSSKPLYIYILIIINLKI